MPTPAERAQAHYTRWLALGTGPTKRLQWTDRGISFTAIDPFLTPNGTGIGATITAEDSRGPLPTDNPYIFVNPPLGVVTQQAVYDDEWNLITPRIVDTSEVIAAAKIMVYDAVVSRALQLGWTP